MDDEVEWRQKAGRMSGRGRITHEEFAKAWRASGSRRELAEKLGITRQAVSNREHMLRRRGVRLKAFPKHPCDNRSTKETR